MANGYNPDGALAILIGDGGLTQATPTPTLVSSDKVNTCLETQSITRADIFMKPKTDAQIAAIANPTAGMWAFSSDSDNPVFHDGVVWNQINPASGFSYASVNLTTAQIRGMSAAPVQILAAPGTGLTYIVHGFRFAITYAGALFTGGGTINGQYGVTALAAGEDATNGIADTFLTATASSKSVYMTGNDTTVLTSAGTLNQSITITNATAPFAAGGTSSGTVQIWYSIV